MTHSSNHLIQKLQNGGAALCGNSPADGKIRGNLRYAGLDWNEKEAYGLSSMNTLLMR